MTGSSIKHSRPSRHPKAKYNANHPPLSSSKYEPFDYGGMSLIPWQDIRLSVSAARFRGHGDMIRMFYAKLFEEAVFDDRGAWSLALRRQN